MADTFDEASLLWHMHKEVVEAKTNEDNSNGLEKRVEKLESKLEALETYVFGNVEAKQHESEVHAVGSEPDNSDTSDSEHDEIECVSPTCDRSFDSKRSFTSHFSVRHGGLSRLFEIDDEIICPKCSESFVDSLSFGEHIGGVHDSSMTDVVLSNRETFIKGIQNGDISVEA